jgi:hypothetical protein
MAKQPETIDRFLITAETPPELVGPALAALAKLGIDKVGYQFHTDVLRYKGRSGGAKGSDIAIEFVKANARFTHAQMVQHFESAGMTAASAYALIRKLKAANVISVSGDELVRVEALTGPAAAPAKAAKAGKRGGRRRKMAKGVSNREFIQRILKGRKAITIEQLSEAFTKDGRLPKSISPIVTKLVATKALKRTAPGTFSVNGAAHG